jgi:hypothetical protein
MNKSISLFLKETQTFTINLNDVFEEKSSKDCEFKIKLLNLIDEHLKSINSLLESIENIDQFRISKLFCYNIIKDSLVPFDLLNQIIDFLNVKLNSLPDAHVNKEKSFTLIFLMCDKNGNCYVEEKKVLESLSENKNSFISIGIRDINSIINFGEVNYPSPTVIFYVYYEPIKKTITFKIDKRNDESLKNLIKNLN